MTSRLVAVAAACLVLGAGCATNGTPGSLERLTSVAPAPPRSATPTATPTGIPEPPAAFLVAPEGRDVRGAAGTRCWSNVCADFVAPVTNPEPFLLHAGSGFTLRFDDPQPDHIEVTWSVADEVPPVENGRRLWVGTGGRAVEAASGRVPDGLGDYVVEVFAQWQGRGDASYGFYVAVR